MSENLENITKKTAESFSEYLFRQAKESFGIEKNFYNTIGFQVSDLNDLIKKLSKKDNYLQFLQLINKQLYGSESEPKFLESLRSSRFYNEIYVGSSKNPYKKFLSSSYGKNMMDVLSNTLKKQKLNENPVTTLANIIDESLKNFSATYAEDSKKFGDKIIANIIDAVQDTLSEIDLEATVKARKKDNHAYSNVTKSKRTFQKKGKTITEDMPYTIPIEIIFKEENGQELIYINGEKIKNSILEEQNFDVNSSSLLTLFDATAKKTFLSVFIPKLKEKIKSDNEWFENNGNVFVIEYNSLKKEENDIDRLVKTFFNVMSKGLEAVGDQQSFIEYWDSRGKSAFEKHIKNRKKDVEDLLFSHTERQKEKGDIGELLMQIFIESLGENFSAQNLGDVNFGTGSAAVDVVMLSKSAEDKLIKSGFQVKNYPGSEYNGDTILYEASNQIFYQGKSLRRYLGDNGLNELINFLWRYSKQESTEEEINNIQSLLLKSIPEYIRYSEAYMSEQIKEDEILKDLFTVKNNFYVINFRIFPASIILSFIASAVSTKENVKNRLFFFSENTIDKGRPNQNLIFNSSINGFSESLNIFKNAGNLNDSKYALNFRGIKITFVNPDFENNANFVNFK